MATMKAALYNGPEIGLSIGRISKPVARPDEILVKIKGASLCHSEFMLLDDKQQPPPQFPIVPGHEATGIVESVGSEVKSFAPGDAVGFHLFYHPCRKCAGCKVHPMVCPEGRVHGFTTNGFFAEYCAIEAASAIKLPDGMDVLSAAPLFCAGLTAFHAVDKCGLKEGDWLGVVGVGGLGHLAIKYAMAMGLNVAAVDIDNARLKNALDEGATAAFNSKEPDFLDKLRATTLGGVSASAVFSGAMPAYETGVQILALGGLLMVVGLPDGNLPLQTVPLTMGLYKVAGASSGTPEEMEKAVLFTHKHNIVPKITKYKLEQFPEMVQLMRSGKFEGRMVVVF